MKKLIAGVAASAAALTMSAEAKAQTNNLCDPVYDETLTGDRSAQLVRQIDAFEQEGIEVHVQIFANGALENIHNDADAERVANQIIDHCGFGYQDFINVLIAAQPQSNEYVADFNVQTNGRATDDISDNRYYQAEDVLIAELGDESTDFQADAGAFLMALNPYTREAIAPPAATSPGDQPTTAEPLPTGSQAEQPASKGLELPVIPIAGSVVALAVTAAGVTRIVRGRRLNRTVSSTVTSTNTFLNNLDSLQGAAEQQLSILHSDDAPALREQLKQLKDSHIPAIQAARNELETAHAERNRWWPRATPINAKVVAVGQTSDAALELVKELKVEHDRIQSLVTEGATKAAEFSEAVASIGHLIAEREAEGWEVGHYSNTFTKLIGTVGEINRLRNGLYVERPAALIDDASPRVEAVIHSLTTLEDQRLAASNQHAEAATELVAIGQRVQEAQDLFKNLKQRYHNSCLEDIKDYDQKLAEALEVLNAQHQAALALVEVKKVAALESLQAANIEVSRLYAELSEQIQPLHSLASQLEGIEGELPDRLRVLEDDARALQVYAFESFPDDITDPTRQAILELQADLETIINGEAKVAKPKLLAIDERLKELKGNLINLDQQARAEKTEIDGLRSSVVTVADTSATEHRELIDYINRHPDVTSATAGLAEIIYLLQADPNADRANLRHQSEQLSAQLTEIRRVRRAAQADVKEAKEARARAAAREAARIKPRVSGASTMRRGNRRSVGGSVGRSNKGGRRSRGGRA